MKQNSTFMSERVVMGLFSLLFILSAAQVSALLNMGDYQLAQVVNFTNDKKCLQVTHLYNTDEFFHNGASSPQPGNFYRFRGFFNIKNVCAFDITIIDPFTLNQPGTFDFATLQGLSNTGTPVNLNTNDSSVFSSNVSGLFSEKVDCPNCFNPEEQFAFYSSSTATSPSGVGGFKLSSGTTRTFFVQTYVPVYDTSETVNQYQNFIRVMVNKFKWFRQSALSNGNVEANEIVTQSFSIAEKNMHVGDYVRFKHTADYPEITGESTKEINQVKR
jgi:hypothetical protein